MKRTLLALSALTAVAFAGAGHAQPANRPPPPPQAGAERPQFDPAKMAERRAQHLRDTLQLTSAQEPALRAFLDATTPKGDPRQRFAERRAEGPATTTPQRIERARKMRAERQARFDQVTSATLRFYNQLTPSQQKAFDVQHQGRRGGMRGGPRGRGGHGGHEGFKGGFRGHGPQGGPPPR